MNTIRLKVFKCIEVGRLKNTVVTVALLIFLVLFVSISHLPNSGFINIIAKDASLPRIYPDECVRIGIDENGKITDWITCLRTGESVTETINMAGNWEEYVSKALANIFRLFPDAAYLDIGANIGPHVTMAAKYTNRVYAVDPSLENLAYIRHSLELEGTEDNVVLINNVISDSQTTLYPFQPDATNNAMVFFLPEEELRNKKKPNYAHRSNNGPMTTATFQQLLDVIPEQNIILKIDVEGSECKVLSDYMKKKDKDKYIPFIVMEWEHIKGNDHGLCPDLDSLIQGFHDSGYYPFSVDLIQDSKQISFSALKDYNDIMWIHSATMKQIRITKKVYKIPNEEKSD